MSISETLGSNIQTIPVAKMTYDLPSRMCFRKKQSLPRRKEGQRSRSPYIFRSDQSSLPSNLQLGHQTTVETNARQDLTTLLPRTKFLAFLLQDMRQRQRQSVGASSIYQTVLQSSRSSVLSFALNSLTLLPPGQPLLLETLLSATYHTLMR